jgi:SpoVK/Ycf46/Vps4 family AAA+-type ATPase
MAAEAVAQALSLALFRVDLSVLMSKYIGETAKNLRRTLDAAEAGGAVLLFDEADAVFSKRSEVKDSHDRYANIDIDYLLSRMETFRGVALLATNMKHALDIAFLRRLRFVIGFPFPGAAERKAIWRGVFPRPDRVGELDLDHLARFVLTGGGIFNAALAAAHSAVSEHAQIEMRHVLDAIRWELRKIERPAAESAFLPREPVVS